MDLQQTLQTLRQRGIDDDDMSAALSTLAIVAYEMFQKTGRLSDINLAVNSAQLSLTMPGYTVTAGGLNNLGVFLQSRYERTGEMVDLQEAIDTARQVVNLTPADHPDRAPCLNNLGNMLQSRYERTGEMADLQEAIDTAREAVDSTPADHPDRAGRLSNLGTKLESRYERTGEMAGLQEAIDTAREAVDSTPADHPDRATCLNNLGNILKSRYERIGEMADLREAIDTAREAVDSTPADHPDRAGMLSNLGNMLLRRYERTGEMADLQEAIDTARQAVDSTPADHPDRAGRLNNLGNMLQSRYKRTGNKVDLDHSITSFQTAWNSATAVPFHRIKAGARCLTLLASHHQLNEAVNLGMAILDFLPYINTRLLDRSDQQFVISTFAGVAADLCSVYLLLGQPADALRQLERGRAVIISQLLDARSDFSVLEQQYPDICRRFQHLRDEVSRPLQQAEEGPIRRQIRARRVQALAELEVCVEEIRCLTGHEQFMRGQRISEMRDCAAEGTIVVVNVTTIHSGAIIVSPEAIKVVELTRLAVAEAQTWLREKWTGSDIRKAERPKKNKRYLEYLAWLWDVCVKPILDKVCPVANRASVLPRIWWIGSGLASSMPFHAAGVHSGGSRENALHRTISSYSPSIKALSHARQWAATTDGAKGSLLITTMPTTPGDGMSDLPGVEEERIRLVDAAGGCLSVTHLESPGVEDVIKALPQYTIAHFACHGVTNYLDPSQSGLVLQKGTLQDRLTVQKVSEMDLRNAKIAYLSACSTAQNEAGRLSDEVIHVVSGFQVAGFPHVIGCLWPSNDRVCVQVADRFYQSLVEDGRGLLADESVAWALHKAVAEARDADPGMPLYWAPYVHFGA